MPANSETAAWLLRRTLIYGVLLAGAAFFLFPLGWMLSTSLKPLDQTMRMPPTWIPYGYQVEHQGQRLWVSPTSALPDEGEVRVVAEHRYTAPGTYFVALRGISQRNGDRETPYARIANLGRVRVVVE